MFMLKIVITALVHFLITIPSFVYYGYINVRNRINAELPNLDPVSNRHIVIYIHGMAGHYSCFHSLTGNVQTILSDPNILHRFVQLDNTTQTLLDDDVKNLASQLDKYKDCKITLIGLSKGGLIAMRYITTTNDNRVDKVITISSPLNGTYMADFLPSSSSIYKQLRHNSEITQEIARADISIPIYHIIPRWDHLIIPVESARYKDTDEKNVFYYDGFHGHLAITHSNDIAKFIAGTLKNPTKRQESVLAPTRS